VSGGEILERSRVFLLMRAGATPLEIILFFGKISFTGVKFAISATDCVSRFTLELRPREVDWSNFSLNLASFNLFIWLSLLLD